MSLASPVALHPAAVALRRRQRAGAVNRRIGWVLLVLILAATSVHYLFGNPAALSAALVALVALVNTVHLGLSVYVFGFVRPRLTLRVFHVYFGYALGILIWASQTNLDNAPLLIAMFAGIAAHLLLATRHAARRRAAQHAAARLIA